MLSTDFISKSVLLLTLTCVLGSRTYNTLCHPQLILKADT